jgi:hypothetical protein
MQLFLDLMGATGCRKFLQLAVAVLLALNPGTAAVYSSITDT